jgi:hypothetical protein
MVIPFFTRHSITYPCNFPGIAKNILFPKRLILTAVILSIHSIFENIPRIKEIPTKNGEYFKIPDESEYTTVAKARNIKTSTVNEKKLYRKSQKEDIG